MRRNKNKASERLRIFRISIKSSMSDKRQRKKLIKKINKVLRTQFGKDFKKRMIMFDSW